MVATSIVRLGPNDDNISAKLLRAALITHFQKLQEGPSNNTIDEKSGSVLTISNKYFTAKVAVVDIGSSKDSTLISNSKEDGIILVFDALQSNPDRPNGGSRGIAHFDALTIAHTEIEEKDKAGDLLRLCVGVSLTSLSPEELRGKEAEKEYSRRILWCLDRGYEYIEADLSEEGQLKGHDERDKEGFARIVEAVQGTVWSSAVMKKEKTKQLQTSYEDESNALQENIQEKKEEENPYQPPDPSRFTSMQSNSAIAVAEKQSADGLTVQPENVSTKDMQNMMETDEMFDKMESVLKEASRIRAASKAGEMNDEERRARAGDAAMALVNLMGQFGMEDDDSFAENSSDDSGIVDD